ncbi:hypothetical protein RMATCC62417_04438 [Rhizopus microsporus]|nr:hypothetical protein RMATCC62417_04438 [Rhizopus microsporus]
MAPLTDNQKIRKQVNFYFSDSNLPYDKYLWTLHANAENHWIPLSIIAGFKKVRMITEDEQAVLDALKEEESDIYELDVENKNIRRKGEVVKQDHVSRSIHVKGLPLVDEGAEKPVDALIELQDKMEDFFNEKAKVLAIRLKKHDDTKKFKGSAYIEFENPEAAKKVAELKEVEFDGHNLAILYRPEYHKLKEEEYKGQPMKRKKKNFNAFRQQPERTNKRKRNDPKSRQNKRTKKENETPKAEEAKGEEVKAEEKVVGEEKKEEKAE